MVKRHRYSGLILLLVSIEFLLSPMTFGGEYKPLMCSDCTKDLCETQMKNKHADPCCNDQEEAQFENEVCKCCITGCSLVSNPKYGPKDCKVICKGPKGYKTAHIHDKNCTKPK